MLLNDSQILSSVKINALIRDQFERYQEGLPLRFLDRTPIVPADDDEITAYYTGRIEAAAARSRL